MKPPPIEKNVRSSTRFPVPSYAANLSPFGCCVRAPGGNIVSRSKTRSLVSSNAMLRFPASSSIFVARITPTVASITPGSMVAGSFPDKPSSTARSVPWPIPVKASEPNSRTCTRTTFSSSPFDSSSRAKRHAARIGPMVCELEGPTPSLYKSKRLVVTQKIVAPATSGSQIALVAASNTC